ncbi:MAG: thioredoxin domain-containing protein [Candidatus Bathyarchaeota archaeon]|nr:thioredoxin domain-containing protein [Candidatus Bathyarchaeota archaeon]
MQANPNPERKPNKLIHEKSPYLLQHAYNPVDWYPWSQEALDKAKKENKPIFLSIGYSACHWCHVMEKECFQDSEVAQLLNKTFVCIKVDREERPDIDAAYMAVCQEIGQSCGWPLHVIMTPNLNPFFAASYIPKEGRYGMKGLMQLIPQIQQVWGMQQRHLDIVGADVKSKIEALQRRSPVSELGVAELDEAFEQLRYDFDAERGGFGSAPKFPRAHTLMFLLRYYKRTGNKEALEMVEKSLGQMRRGGIFDQVGFGFHRYSTDANWLVPHFEKMLYDQAWLTLAYTEAYQATKAGKYKITAKETIEYVLRDLTAKEGVFYSAEDADSEGEEGRFYLWTLPEVKEAVSVEDAKLAVSLFGLSLEGNYVEAATRTRTGKNILHLPKPIQDIAASTGLSVDELIGKLDKIQQTLYQVRKNRVHPTKDEKVLTDWNGLMIAALAKASKVFGEKQYLQAAIKAADFILKDMRSSEGVLYHRYMEGERAIEGFLDDYAFVVFGLIEVYEASFEEKYLQAASQLTKIMTQKFWDEADGGFYLTEQQKPSAMPRIKQVYDGAFPSGNSVALLNLQKLSRLLDEPAYEDMASKLIRTFAQEVQGAPAAYTYILSGVDFAVGNAGNVVLVGAKDDEGMEQMRKALQSVYLPNLTVSQKQPEETDEYKQLEGKATAYVCRGQSCLPPTNSPQQMLKLLE